MSFHHGSRAFFSVDGNDLTAFCDNVDFSRPQDVAESSTFGTDAKTYIGGMSDGTVSISGKWDETAVTGPDAVLTSLFGTVAGAAVEFEFGPEGGDAGMIRYTGNVIMTGYNVTAPIGDVVAFTADFQISGAITTDTFPV